MTHVAGTCFPAYDGAWLGSVIPSAVAAVGGDGWPNPLGLPAASSYVVFLIDGLGWNLLLAHVEEAPYLSQLAEQQRTPITSGVPSTTVTSLTSLGTGLPTGAHGIVGFTSRIPGTDRLLDALRWDPHVDPREWQPHQTVFARAEASGVHTTVVGKRIFEHSGLTQAGQRGAEFVGADTVGERISAAVHSASRPGSVTYVYDGKLDATGHRSGSRSWAWRHQLGIVDAFAARLRGALPPGAALVVTADHGMVDIDFDDRVDVDADPALTDGVRLLGGEARFRHVYCENGAVDDVLAAWSQRLGERALVMSRSQAIEDGWFGPTESAVRPRLGDVIVASVGKVAIMSTNQFPYEATLVGLHGSVTADEMLVPLLVDLGPADR